MAVLLADIGGTNARFCWYERGKLGKIFDYKCDDFKTIYDVIDRALQDFPKPLNGILIAGAGPVKKGILSWTNRIRWKISVKKLQKRHKIDNVLVINDVQAQGEGLKTVYNCNETSILMTAGTGLGGCFIVNGRVVAGEVGQIKNEEGIKMEDFISGPGIVRLYHQFGGNKKIKSARKIEELCFQKDKAAQKAFKTFYMEWGKLSARLITAFYALGGVYLWGGLLPKTETDKKVLMLSYQKTLPANFQKIPLRLVKNKGLTFKGLESLLRREFGQSWK